MGHDAVNHPAHYTRGKVETIESLESMVIGLEGIEAALTFQVGKYIARWRHKGRPVEDLQKAEWYLKRLIAVATEKEKKKLEVVEAQHLQEVRAQAREVYAHLQRLQPPPNDGAPE